MQGHCALTNKRKIPATLPGFQSRFIDPLLHDLTHQPDVVRESLRQRSRVLPKKTASRQSLIPSWRRCSCQFCSDRLFGVICRWWAIECIDQIARPSPTRRAILPNPRHKIGSNLRHEIRATSNTACGDQQHYHEDGSPHHSNMLPVLRHQALANEATFHRVAIMAFWRSAMNRRVEAMPPERGHGRPVKCRARTSKSASFSPASSPPSAAAWA